VKRSGPPARRTVRQLTAGEPDPPGEPRRYEESRGYVRLRWKVGTGEYVERYERDEGGKLRRTQPSRAKRIDAERAAALYADGLTLPEVAAHLGCDHGALSRVLRRHGVTARPANSYHHPEPDADEIVRRYEAGDGLRPIARALATSTTKVRAVLAQRGVTVRQRRQADRRLSAYDAEFRRMRPVVRRRSGGRCEAGVAPNCTGRATHVHHRQLRSQGGPNSLANLLDVCVYCHGVIHGHPLVRGSDDPEAVPVTL
jgi:hypothetical protein